MTEQNKKYILLIFYAKITCYVQIQWKLIWIFYENTKKKSVYQKNSKEKNENPSKDY